MKHIASLVGWLLVSSTVHAQLPPSKERPPAFTDPLLDNLVGDWQVARKFSDGRQAECSLHVEWVLNHQFLELHYRPLISPPDYEARVFIGFDPKAQRYIVHWLDVSGGIPSKILASGTLDEAAHTIYFQWSYPDSQLINAFAFDPASKTWLSITRQKSKGPWTVLVEDRLTKR
jgi:Protein of unknown function (DUF1579)